jgi:hypothetical protein
MSINVNGQPASNTIVRLDGVTAQSYFPRHPGIQPSIEAIETVSLVTSSSMPTS